MVSLAQLDRTPRRWTLVLVAGLVAWTALALAVDNGIFGALQDDGLYLASARSLRDGRGFGLPSRPGEPPPKYPIGLPALLGLALKLDPAPTLAREVAVARGVVILGGWGFFLAAFGWLRRVGAGPPLACAIVLTTAFHHVVQIGGAATLFADLPFAAVAYLLLARFVAPRREGSGWARAAVDGSLAGFGFLLRTNGITLIAAALLANALGRGRARWRLVPATLAAVALVAVPATRYAGRHPRVVPSNSYFLELKAGWTTPGAGLRLVGRNLLAVAGDLPARVLLSPTTYVDPLKDGLASHPAASWVIRGACTLLVGFGLIRLARATRRRDLPAWVHALGTVAIFAVWPWEGILDRFTITLFPMILLAFARGAEGLLGLVPALAADRPACRRLATWAVVVALAGNGAVVCRAVRYFRAHGGQWPGTVDRADLGRALALIRARTEPDAVVASAWPELVALHTGRTSVPIFEDEAVMTRHFGDVTRLRLWLRQGEGRPFYFLHRTEPQDADHADDQQMAALTPPGSRLAIRCVAAVPSGRYLVSRLVVDPAR